MKLDYDTWEKLNIKISKLNGENEFLNRISEEDIEKMSEEQSDYVRLGVLTGYLDILNSLGLVVRARASGDFYIDPKCVNPMN